VCGLWSQKRTFLMWQETTLESARGAIFSTLPVTTISVVCPVWRNASTHVPRFFNQEAYIGSTILVFGSCSSALIHCFNQYSVYRRGNLYSQLYICLIVVTNVWADENPSEIISGHHQQGVLINVRAGITGNEVSGPYMLPARLPGRRYHNFMQRCRLR
jgi:hypothetical protein